VTSRLLLREAIKAVPAVKYALAVGGILAVVAIVRTFGISQAYGFVAAIGMFVLMFGMLLFARLSSLAAPEFRTIILLFAWSLLVLFVGSAALVGSSVFFRWPLDVGSRLVPLQPYPKSQPQTQVDHGTGTQMVAEPRERSQPYPEIQASATHRPRCPTAVKIEASGPEQNLASVRVDTEPPVAGCRFKVCFRAPNGDSYSSERLNGSTGQIRLGDAATEGTFHLWAEARCPGCDKKVSDSVALELRPQGGSRR